MLTGQAAGTAAAMALISGDGVADIDVSELQDRLRSAGVVFRNPAATMGAI